MSLSKIEATRGAMLVPLSVVPKCLVHGDIVMREFKVADLRLTWRFELYINAR